jgi:hypothetical protein
VCGKVYKHDVCHIYYDVCHDRINITKIAF